MVLVLVVSLLLNGGRIPSITQIIYESLEFEIFQNPIIVESANSNFHIAGHESKIMPCSLSKPSNRAFSFFTE